MNAYEQRQWQITEKIFRSQGMPHAETIYTIGNGLVGVRGTFEEGYPGDDSTTLAAGVFNHKAGQLVPELVSMPNWLSLKIRVDGDICRLDEGRILGYERVLDMHTATLRRGVLWLSPNRVIVRLAFERFTSLANQHVLALRVLVQVLSEGTHTVDIINALDGSILNPEGIDHWRDLNGTVAADTLSISGVTEQSGYGVALASKLLVDKAGGTWAASSAPRVPAHTYTLNVEQNEKIIVTKIVALHTTRNSENPVLKASETLRDAVASGYDALKTAHDAAWAAYWDAFDVIIEGDEVAQRAVRFCTYHFLIATPTQDDRVSIAAKTLSGFGYKGHVFWDTELFLLPPMTLSQPELTKRLLMYRYHNLPGARNKAKANGYEGAMYPWESTDTGEETTPQWTNPHPVTGERIRIWTGDNEQHISTDIAYAILLYWRWTGDDEWFAEYGAEMVLDTAKFWGSRAEYNAEKGRYELKMQIGPDEYHENVDNSVFTNRMTVWHLQQAQQVYAWLQHHRPADAQRLTQSLDLTPERRAKWQDIAAKMWIPMSDEGGGVFEQFETFFQRLQPINLEDYTPRTTNMDWIMGHEKTQRSRVIKQADVVMLMALLGDELGDNAFLERNWQLYSNIVDHGSSLSPSMHAWVAARLGHIAEAYELFIYAATIDLDDHKGNVRDGIHAACCGGVWQAVVFGFCGLELTENGFTTDAKLPSHWQRVAFKVQHHGKTHAIEIKNTAS
jgi:kojibiose phosphorylase